MGYDCSCGWTSGEDSDGDTMPDYIVANSVQNAHCPRCSALLDQRENNLDDLGARF